MTQNRGIIVFPDDLNASLLQFENGFMLQL